MKPIRVYFPGEAMWLCPDSDHVGTLLSDPVSNLHPALRGDKVRWRWSSYSCVVPRADGTYSRRHSRCREFVEVVERSQCLA